VERGLELACVYGLAPLIVYLEWWPRRAGMWLLALAAVAAGSAAAIGGATGRQLGIAGGDLSACLRAGLGAWALAQAAAMGVRRWRRRPMFPFAGRHPHLFATLAAAYFLSVLGQEFLFRGFFFWRYAGLAAPPALFALNVLLFGWIHIVFKSWLSVALTLIGGVLFTALFVAYHSLAGLCVVHWAFGMSIFAMGYGRHFYGGDDDLARRLRSGVEATA
jgi:membrane protease YdiL (CAAX protease family)